MWRSHAKLVVVASVSAAIGYAVVWAVGADALASSLWKSGAAIAVISPVVGLVFFLLMRALGMPEAAGVTMLVGKVAGRLRR